MIRQISSPTNQRVKNLLKMRHKYFIFEGEKLVKDILKRGEDILILIVNRKKEEFISNNCHAAKEIWLVNETILRKISVLNEKSDYIAFLEIPNRPVSLGPNEAVFVLDQVQDPANTGTIFRCAAGFGIGSIVLSGSAVRPNNPKFLRAAQDSIFAALNILA